MGNQRLACLAVSALGGAVVWFATANGVGISRDCPSVDGARLDAGTRATLHARMVDSTDVVVLYSLAK
ncbi:MAG: hypothetical protein L0Z51_03925 [Candidatus Latescibacteria bacterium]|nr:hypothetical protein [Candidatus Latescibacterota bacterium]